MTPPATPPPTWGVVATISEPPPLVLAFVAHWLGLGAARVTLCLDGPAPEIARRLAGQDRVETLDAFGDWWPDRAKGRPTAISQRQRRNLRKIWARTDLDWLFHVDADEFLVADRPVAALLASLDPEADHAEVAVAERVFDGAPDPDTIFGGLFRSAVAPGAEASLAAIDGTAAPLLDRGLAGYPGCKSAFRRGRAITPGIHGPEPPDQSRRAILHGARLLHFDGLTAGHWLWKKRRTVAQQPVMPGMRSAVAAQRAALAAAETDAEALAIYESLKCLAPGRLAALEARGLIHRDRIDPGRAAWDMFGREGLDFSPAAFAYDGIEYVPWRPDPFFRWLVNYLRLRLRM